MLAGEWKEGRSDPFSAPLYRSWFAHTTVTIRRLSARGSKEREREREREREKDSWLDASSTRWELLSLSLPLDPKSALGIPELAMPVDGDDDTYLARRTVKRDSKKLPSARCTVHIVVQYNRKES